jgi:MoxR-like ATPase
VRGSLALERAARGWALLNDRGFVVPDDVERLFAPVLMHRIVFRPAFLAEARRHGWVAATEEFKEACLAAAPKPQADPDGEVFALDPRPS